MPSFKLTWRDGKTQVVTGDDIADAMTNAGYGRGALAALDTHEEIKGSKDQEDIEKIKEYCDEVDGKFYPDYSGRGMFGAVCVGVVVDDANDCIAAIGRKGARTDNMGRQMIVYWPGLKVDSTGGDVSDDDEGEESDDENDD